MKRTTDFIISQFPCCFFFRFIFISWHTAIKFIHKLFQYRHVDTIRVDAIFKIAIAAYFWFKKISSFSIKHATEIKPFNVQDVGIENWAIMEQLTTLKVENWPLWLSGNLHRSPYPQFCWMKRIVQPKWTV